MRQTDKTTRVIYRLWHNKSAFGRIGYVGKDSHYPSRVYLVRRAKDKDSPKLYLALKKYPLKFWDIQVLQSGFRKESTLNKAEIFYIKKYDSKNKGYNCTDGGDGKTGWSPSPETRAKLSKIAKNRKYSLETRRKLSLSHMGIKHSAESKAKIGRANSLRVVSPETRAKLSKNAKERKYSIETRTKMSLVGKNKKVSDETRKRLSVALSGKNNPMYGKTPSLESREKMSRAGKTRWARWRRENQNDS
jgi:NUMOD3 motif-containing protein